MNSGECYLVLPYSSMAGDERKKDSDRESRMNNSASVFLTSVFCTVSSQYSRSLSLPHPKANLYIPLLVPGRLAPMVSEEPYVTTG